MKSEFECRVQMYPVFFIPSVRGIIESGKINPEWNPL